MGAFVTQTSFVYLHGHVALLERIRRVHKVSLSVSSMDIFTSTPMLDLYRFFIYNSRVCNLDTNRVWVSKGVFCFHAIWVYIPCKNMHTWIRSPKYQASNGIDSNNNLGIRSKTLSPWHIDIWLVLHIWDPRASSLTPFLVLIIYIYNALTYIPTQYPILCI
jgi:hypothetical protein